MVVMLTYRAEAIAQIATDLLYKANEHARTAEKIDGAARKAYHKGQAEAYRIASHTLRVIETIDVNTTR